MIPKATVYTTASQPERVVWNRYGTRTIGIAFRVGFHRLLSIQWRRPESHVSEEGADRGA